MVEMADGRAFEPGLYRGAAEDYDRFRTPYPGDMIDDLLRLVAPSGYGRLLDLACGTGQVAFALSDRFDEVCAVDEEPDMIRVVDDKARAAGVAHVRGIVSRIEDLDVEASSFDLVTIGNAFHRLRRETVASHALGWLAPGRCIALLWASTPWSGAAEWQRALAAALTRWVARLGVEERVPEGWDRVRRMQPDVAVLAGSGFRSVHSARFPTVHEWTIDDLIGFAYSTSFLPRVVVGRHARAFEDDLRRELNDHARGGKLRATVDFAFEVARRPR